MIGRWFIDDTDIFKAYDLGITSKGFSDLFLFPSLVTPEYNDWAEEDGIEVDLSNPVVHDKSVNIQFASVSKDNVLVDSFLNFLGQTGYRKFRIESLGRDWNLRVALEQSRNVYRNGQIFSIQFKDDNPINMLSETAKAGHGLNFPMSKSKYSIDGVRFDEYGIIVSNGKKSVFAMPKVKETLSAKSNYSNGVRYDTGIVRYAAKDVTLDCWLVCDTIDRFWQNYSAFFSDLIQPNERILGVEYIDDEFKCFYKSMSNPSFFRNSRYTALKFTLTLTFTDFRPKKTYYVLGTEDLRILGTEDLEALIIEGNGYK